MKNCNEYWYRLQNFPKYELHNPARDIWVDRTEKGEGVGENILGQHVSLYPTLYLAYE